MRYIESFANDAAIQGALDNGSLGHPYLALDDQTHKIDLDNKENSNIKKYFTIEALERGSIRGNNRPYYSINGGEWSLMPNSDLQLNAGDVVRFKSTSPSQYSQYFQSNNQLKCKAYGNVMSLIYGDDFLGKSEVPHSTFQYLFDGWTNLMDVSNLMLPGETLGKYCYNKMFRGCVNIEKAPYLPAETIGDGSYSGMFSGCTALNYIKCLATNPVSSRISNWVLGVAETGTFVKKAGVDWPTGSSGIPSGWTVINA